MNKGTDLLPDFKQYFDIELNLASKNLPDNSEDDYEQVKSIFKILEELGIKKKRV